MVLYFNTYLSIDNYENELKNCYIKNKYYDINIPILLYSSLFSLVGLTYFVDINNYVNIPLCNFKCNNHYYCKTSFSKHDIDFHIINDKNYDMCFHIIYDKNYDIYINENITSNY